MYIIPRMGNTGYLQVGLYLDSKVKRHSVHRLVALAFIDNPNLLKEVNHKDGDRINNCASNLEWVSRSDNALHSTRVLCKNRGEENTLSKLSEIQVLEIKNFLEAGESQIEIAKRYNVTNHTISRIRRGYNWSWLTGYEKKGKETSCAH